MRNYILLFMFSSLIFSCTRREKKEDIVEINQSLNMDDRFINFEVTRKEGDAHQGKFYSSTDSARGFTAGYNYVLPDSLKNKKIKVTVSAWLREPELPQEGGLIVSLTTSKGTAGWDEIGQFNKVMIPGKWVLVSGSVDYSSEKTNDSFVEIGVIGVKPKGKDVLDIDDINMNIKVYK